MSEPLNTSNDPVMEWYREKAEAQARTWAAWQAAKARGASHEELRKLEWAWELTSMGD